MDLTTAGLISDVKLSALLPDGMFEDDDIISFLNDGYYSEVLPFMMRHREDFYVTYTDFDPAATIEIPSDSIAQKLKDVQVKSGDRYTNLPRLSMGEITASPNSWTGPVGFYIQDNTIVFYPRAQTNTVRLVYYKRPHYMEDSTIDTDEANVDGNTVYKVTGITSAVLTVSPNPVANLGAGVSVSFTQSKSYQPFNVVDSISLTTGPAADQFTAASEALAATFTVGDYLCNPNYTAFPKIPFEAREILVQSAIVKAMTSMKDKEGYGIAMTTLKDAKKTISGLISPRVDNEIKKIVNTSSAIWNNRNGWRK